MSSETKINEFKIGDLVVYPSHGVGTISSIEVQNIGGMPLEMFEIAFEKEKMSLKIPTTKAKKSGLRHVSGVDQFELVFKILKTPSKPSKGMWSKRVTEYEAKINSGDLNLLAEVVRDLHKNVEEPSRSYSERVIYESALNRLGSEIALSQNISDTEAKEKLVSCIRVKAA